jgi:hypothetical protein
MMICKLRRFSLLGISMAAVLGSAVPSFADDGLFTAMARLVGHGSVSELQGEMKDGNLVDLYTTQSGVEAHVMSPGGDPCVLVHLWVGDRTGEFAQVSTKTYDFRKLIGARFLADADDRETAASRDPEDTEVTELLLEGAGWSVHRITHVDPAKPAFHQEIENSWSIVLLGPEDRSAAAAALAAIQAGCSGSPPT